MKNIVIASLIFLLSYTAPCLYAQSPSEIEIIFDASRSMNDMMGSVTKMDSAKQVLTTVAAQIDPQSRVGLRIFGATPIQGNIQQSCTDSVLAFPVGPFQRDLMVSKVLILQSFGMTALGYSLEQSANDFSKDPGVKKTIILISDGEETCGKDPIAVMQALKAQGLEIKIHAIGFAASEAAKAQLKQLADMSQGSYREASDAAQLQQSLQEIAQQEKLLTIQRGGGENILAAAAGTQIVTSSTQTFAEVIDGSEKETRVIYPGQEVVFSFKDGQPVLLEAFAIPIFGVTNHNPSEFKLLGSVESPETGFFSIADFKVENKVFFGNVYQEFKIEPPAAIRFLKVVVGSGSGGGHSYHTEWKAYGRYMTEEEFAAEAAKIGPREINILAAENGGKLIAAANMEFERIIDGKGDQVGASASIQPPAEGIFSFRDGRTALIEKFDIPVFEASNYNCKGIEVSASMTGPTGEYTPIGSFETINMVFAGNPFQEHKLESPAKAKFVKIKVLSTYGMYYCKLPEIRIFGTLGET